jgi:hypothetical protein
MKSILLFLCYSACLRSLGQTDSGNIVIRKDPRIDLLIKKQIQINDETTRESRRYIQGFRIQVINSSDRNKVFALKGQIYQQYPELKPYLVYQPPNYRLKVGNFRTEEEAQPYLQRLSVLFPSGLYIVPDMIDTKPD